MMLGRGAVQSTSTKQKVNTRSMTEVELVSSNNIIAKVMWTKQFLQAQGYLVTDMVVYQDNMSSILLEKNGKASSSKHTKHINIHYFFVTALGLVIVEWIVIGCEHQRVALTFLMLWSARSAVSVRWIAFVPAVWLCAASRRDAAKSQEPLGRCRDSRWYPQLNTT